jgi:hypothetical protein
VIERPATQRPVPDPVSAQRAPDAIRAQLLATEHWSLLATRSQTWSEVMNRIAIHLTVTSASLVVLALVVQSNGYGTPFDVMSIGLASTVLVLGTLTLMRVHNASADDSMLVIGMNRLRAGYLELDPGLADYLVTSWNDDEAGLMRTYTMGKRRSKVSHIVASTSFFVMMVNTIVAGTLGALIAYVAGASIPITAVTGTLAAVLYTGAWLFIASRTFTDNFGSRFPTG